ncbi:MAG TPA: integrase core domain-containing protein [Anaerolineaceae bacterium]|nr:integrase core domain-containing protein [Anaerolineaceae bacterium]HPN53878.1 integrase core domain-containing protein [Anaerolineaceae bacterium]
MEIDFVLQAVSRLLTQSQPEIFNSDQGSHFTSPQYLALLQGTDIKISMDGKGWVIDNIFAERLRRAIKYEEVYLKEYASSRDARQNLSAYLTFYNRERPYQSLGYRTPADAYRQPASVHEAAIFLTLKNVERKNVP